MNKVFLVGAGPGAPDLLTVRAHRLIEKADIVFYDALIDPRMLELASHARKIAVGKRCGRHSSAQQFINRRLIEAAREYACVVRLKGGDPMLFGRAQEEIDALNKAGVEVEVVPGVTAALAAGAALGVSLTRRSLARSVVFATPRVGANEGQSDWQRAAASADTLVLYMAAGEIERCALELLAGGRSPDTPVAIVYGASWPDSQHGFALLGELARGCGMPLSSTTLPCTICIGEVYRERYVQSLVERSRAFGKAA